MVARTTRSIDGLRRANQATARLLRELGGMAQPGVRTGELDRHARRFIQRIGGEPTFATEKGFPGCINTSINDAVAHGVPGATVLADGDILSIDAGMLLDGFCGDATMTIGIGALTPEHRRLIEITHGAMVAGISAARVGRHIGDIGYAIHSFAFSHGFDVVRELTGHGLGTRMHEPPIVWSYGEPGTGPRIPEGLVITIEPILVERSPRITVDADGWTLRTQDGGWAAQFEHTVRISRRGAEILSDA